MRIALCAAAVLGVGCGRILGIGDFQLGGDAPGGRSDVATIADAAPDLAPGCYGMGLIGSVCVAQGATSLMYSTAIDTDSNVCTRTVANTCAIVGTNITVMGTVAVTGSRPLSLVASNSIQIDGTLDASSASGLNPRVGGGADPASCVTNAGGANASEGAGGGAGGSFGTKGGDGGDDHKLNRLGAPASPATIPTSVVGGCPGGKGGDGQPVNTGGAGGHGGGAIYLLAGQTITIAGAVYASGAGGGAGIQSRGGGGGGGAGGLVGLEAPAIHVTGTVAANGGGGGGGNDNNNGSPGEDGTTASYATAAAGGAPSDVNHAGGGGTGGALGALAGTGVTPPQCCGSGGGGGGAVGVVWVKGMLTGTQISPAASQQ